MTDIEVLANKAELVSSLYARRCDINRDDDWFALKLQEEAGELIAEYLRLSGRGRQRDEDHDRTKIRLADEAADLFAQLLLFCRHNSIDLESALERKWFAHLQPSDS